MVKYYTYYSCGGYKDIYIGSNRDSSEASYFIPLLNVWKKSNKPDNADKIARAERVQHVELISKSNSAGFPSECNLMFSHGGYKAILRTLKDGRQCLSIRDISNGAKDEEGRDIPFNFLFLADGQESIELLDALAMSYLISGNEIDGTISSAISYDPVINGVRFDLAKLNQLLTSQNEPPKKLSHKAGIIDYLKISSRNQYKLSLTEQELDEKNVNSIWDENGRFYGDIAYMEVPSALVEHKDIADGPRGKEFEYSHIPDRFSNEYSGSIIESQFQQIDHKISSLATSEALDNLQSLLKKLSDESNSILCDIQAQLIKLTENAYMVPITSINQDDRQSPFKKNVIMAAGCLIVGFILGALLF